MFKTENSRREIYWMCQLGGWMLYVLLNAFVIYLLGNFNGTFAFSLVFIFLFGILLTQFLRWIIIRFNILNLPISKVLPLLLLLNIPMSFVMLFIQNGFDRIATGLESNLTYAALSLTTLNFLLVFLFWSLIYYLIHFIENYKKVEIEKLRWQAAIHETELNKLKSQLNPHFMFNAMNSIRALVAENPARAKEAITQFSNLLRNTLQIGKQKFIPLSKELEVVKDYIAIESVRLEERLKVEWNISAATETFEVPPLMIQTLVENGIKHGIAKLPTGGTLSIEATINPEGLAIVIRNNGQYDANKIPESGFGIRNSIERLQLLYAGKATFSIANENSEMVITKLFIPQIH